MSSLPVPAVGAQSYWNAEATMMNHCSGTLDYDRSRCHGADR